MAEQRPDMSAVKPDLAQVITAFGMQAMMACGKMMNPVTKKFETDVAMARYHIGVLEVLEQKTEGNRTGEESQLLTDMLHQARLAYVDASQGRGKIEAE